MALSFNGTNVPVSGNVTYNGTGCSTVTYMEPKFGNEHQNGYITAEINIPNLLVAGMLKPLII